MNKLLLRLPVRRATAGAGLGSLTLSLLLAAAVPAPPPVSEGNQVVVVYNRRLPESQGVAEHYAQRRGVPDRQVLGLDLPSTESIGRKEYRQALQDPLLQAFRSRGWLESPSLGGGKGGQQTPTESAGAGAPPVRYLVLCYGVPVKILPDAGLTERGADQLAEPLRRNEAAVDSELALLPHSPAGHRVTGPMENPVYGSTNAALIGPARGALMVARLDGPTAEIARGLVDKALAAETNGLWGRAYFDLRGLTNSAMLLGESWITGAAEYVRRVGFETVVDTRPATFAPGFPMSHIAFYAGWYDAHVSGPFARPQVEFMPGAVAYHLHSFSAASLRTADRYWVGPLLARGATATLGYVAEPYLQFTVNVAALFGLMIQGGFSFGEAAYAAQPVLSWQTTTVGDPLYRPFRRGAGEILGVRFRDLHLKLLAEGSPSIEWSHLVVANVNLAQGYPRAEVIGYLNSDAVTKPSAVLQEKLAELYEASGKLGNAIRAYQRALELNPSPQQKVRIMLALGRNLELFLREREAFELYEQFSRDFPDYPDRLGILQRMLPLAQKLGLSEAEARIAKEIEGLTPATGSSR